MDSDHDLHDNVSGDDLWNIKVWVLAKGIQMEDNKSFMIKDEKMAINLMALVFMCAENDTDECDITLQTNKGKIRCHFEFKADLEDPDAKL